ncbi:hypothetical protein ABZ137_21610 [Streptomyces bobili]|uniref:hypothetical protein n=1 Tax=Streptomyces bobili TaxID=67280 RepID=UPI0033B40D4B
MWPPTDAHPDAVERPAPRGASPYRWNGSKIRALSFALHYLSRHPDVAARARADTTT